jgi:hypothetical protein
LRALCTGFGDGTAQQVDWDDRTDADGRGAREDGSPR